MSHADRPFALRNARRKATLELVESMGPGGVGFLEALENRDGLEGEAELRDVVDRLTERLETRPGLRRRPAVTSKHAEGWP